jgi:hypothetical protein
VVLRPHSLSAYPRDIDFVFFHFFILTSKIFQFLAKLCPATVSCDMKYVYIFVSCDMKYVYIFVSLFFESPHEC